MKTVTVDKLIFKEKLSTIEQLSLKAILFKWVGEPTEGLDDFLPLEYIEHDFAKMKAKEETVLLIQGDEQFSYDLIFLLLFSSSHVFSFLSL